MKILTFNRHESYLAALAATGHELDVVVSLPGEELPWAPYARPAPEGLRLIPFDRAARTRLGNGVYDAVVAHTVRDLALLFPYRAPRFVFCAHIPLFFAGPKAAAKSFAKRAAVAAFAATHDLEVVCGSAWKRATWGLGGTVVEAVPEAMPSLAAALEPGALVVCNGLETRGEELGRSTLVRLAHDVPLTVVGQRNGEVGGTATMLAPRTHAEFLSIVRRFGIYVYPVARPWGDGFNLALLEAMSMGLAVVTVPNASSPVVHGESGLVGADPAALAAHVRRLACDPALRARLGAGARVAIERRCSRRAFAEAWSRCLAPGRPLPVSSRLPELFSHSPGPLH